MNPEHCPSRVITLVDAADRESVEVITRLGWGLGAFTAVFSADLDQVLLVQLGDYAVKYYGARPWTLPGGGVDAGEAASHAAVRELAEECGIEVDLGQLRPAGWLARPYYRGRRGWPGELVLLFAASVATPLPVPHVRAPETADARWVPADFEGLLAVPGEGAGTHPLQPLPRHWVYWAMLGHAALQRPGSPPCVHTYESAAEMKEPPWAIPSATPQN